MATIKIKRGAGSTAPATLNDGELAFAKGSGDLFIGSDATVVKLLDKGALDVTKALAETNETGLAAAVAVAVTTTTDVTNLTTTVATNKGLAVEIADTDASAFGFVIDEDDLVTDSDTKVPTQQSVKAYVDTEVAAAIAGGMSYKGDFNVATVGTATAGSIYEVAANTTFLGVVLEVGDVVTVKEDNPATDASKYTFVNKNIDTGLFALTADKGVASGIASLDANSEVVQLPAGAAAASAGQVLSQNGAWISVAGSGSASETSEGIIEIATQVETDAGTSDVLAITPLKLKNAVIDGGSF